MLLTEATGQPHGAAVTETYLTMAGLRERGWTDAMIREYLGEPDATRPNPRYWSAAPMKLYLAERAEAAEASLEWVERKTRGARRRAAGVAAADRKRVETESLARQLAADLVASLVFPADPQQAAIEAYNKWHSGGCTCPGWHELGFCDKRADASDSPEFLRRIIVNYARHRLTGYDRAYNRLAGRVGHQDAHEILRAEVNAEARYRAVDEAMRVLRPGGQLLIADPWPMARKYAGHIGQGTLRPLGPGYWYGGPWLGVTLLHTVKER